jgi:hypothetical protein
MKKVAYLSVLCLLATLLIFVTTNPNTLPSYFLVIPFLLLFTGLSLGLASLLHWLGMPTNRSLKLGVFYASLPVILIILQSIGQLTIQDVITIVIIFSISYFYISHATAQ